MNSYSKDIKLRVLAAVDAGKSREEAAETFSISEPTVNLWLKRRRETKDVEPRPIPGGPSFKEAALRQWLPSRMPANHDLTLEENRGAFEEAHSPEGSRASVSRAMAHIPVGWPIKKSKVASASGPGERDEEVRSL